MENSNSREYLEKITAAVIDNLRQTGPAPSVQLQDVPRKPFGGMTDEEEAELDDMDEDENKDVRMTEHRWDKQVEHEGEFEASDDDEMARAHGATRQNGNKRTFTDYRKGEMEVDSGNVTPKAPNGASAEEPAGEDAHDVNDDTIEDISAHEQPEKDQPEKEADKPEETAKEAAKETEKTSVDNDGDVGMTDSTPAEETTTIKKEDVEPEAAAEPPAPTEKPTEEEPTTKEAPEATEETTSEPKPSEEAAEKPAEPTEQKDKAEPAGEAMDVDNEKEKSKEPEAPKEKSKSP